MKRIIENIKAGYRLTYTREKQEQVTWEALKKVFRESKWKGDIDDEQKFISTRFNVGNESMEFYYIISDGYFSCETHIIENYPEENTTDLFLLTTHFNNILLNGLVVVNVNKQDVTYFLRKEIILPLIYPELLKECMYIHLKTTEDLLHSFRKIIEEKESPAFIIADLLNKKMEKN